ncbi:MAG: hypothetical protein WDO73_16895 [Ignavibacteriota bacterium]
MPIDSLAADGVVRYGRYRIRPAGLNEYLDAAAAARQTPNFLFDEVSKALGNGAVTMRIAVQIAAADDVVDDATAHWPDDRPEIDFGTLALASVLPNQAPSNRKSFSIPFRGSTESSPLRIRCSNREPRSI